MKIKSVPVNIIHIIIFSYHSHWPFWWAEAVPQRAGGNEDNEKNVEILPLYEPILWKSELEN
jgi:hypothetical protein